MIMKKYIMMIIASLMLVSCLDTVILPDDKTVDEDFWKSKSDVAQMVNGAYAGMATDNVISRLIVWGDYRGDTYVLSPSASDDNNATAQDLADIAAANTQVTNSFSTWSDFYSVINKCNIVLKKAKETYESNVDPNYTEGDYLVDRSQMLALRSLCYFYLVRTFRDVPYVEEAFMNSSQERQMVQSSPAYVLDRCIESLEEASASALKASSYPYKYGDWRRVGWMTEDGINTLLADIYLWRASVLHSDADYQQCIAYCDRVIASKKAQHEKGRNETGNEAFPLEKAQNYYYNLFVAENAEESIFEIQDEANTAICQYLYKFKNNSSTEGYLKASSIFLATLSNPNLKFSSSVFATNDIRYYASIFKTDNQEVYNARKMVSIQSVSSQTSESYGGQGSRDYGSFDQNWPVYRLPDAILMKAEAMVQLVDTVTAGLDDDAKAAKDAAALKELQDVFEHYVAPVNTRACLTTDTMRWASLNKDYKTKTGMEKLVMEERMREFCFEGKRWFDLLRYNYRHVTGVDYNTILADQGEALTPVYSDMMDLALRSRSETAGTKAKMRSEAYLYLPLPNSDVILSSGLKQNPVYSSSNEYERN